MIEQDERLAAAQDRLDRARYAVAELTKSYRVISDLLADAKDRELAAMLELADARTEHKIADLLQITVELDPTAIAEAAA
jgi:hypothetical protein